MYIVHDQIVNDIMSARNYNLRLKGYVGGYDFDDGYVDYVLSKHKDSPVTVLIDSTGGSLKTALSIAAAFRNHGDVSVHFVGLNASAATIASLGAKHISIDSAAMYLVHKCSSGLFEFGNFNADELSDLLSRIEQTKTDLEKFDANVAEMYARKCKKSPQDLLDLMKVGGWLTAKEALDWGFVDEITDIEEDANAKPKLTGEVAAYFCQEGIPMPDVPSSDKEAESMLSKMMTFFSSVFGKHANDNNTVLRTYDNDNHINPQTLQNPETTMKNFQNICALLAMEVLAFTDGKCALTEDQIQALESALADKNTLNASLTEANKSLTEKTDALAALQKDFDAGKTALETKSSELSAKESLLAAKNSEVAAKDTLLAAKDAEINSLRAQVEALRKAPADDTHQVLDGQAPSAQQSDEARFIDEMNEAKKLYNAMKD